MNFLSISVIHIYETTSAKNSIVSDVDCKAQVWGIALMQAHRKFGTMLSFMIKFELQDKAQTHDHHGHKSDH